MPFSYFLTPYPALLADPTARTVALLAVMVLKAFCVIIAFPSTTILLTNSCTSLQVLGTLNGFATMFSGLGRAAGPFLTGVVFDWGAEKGYILSAYWFLGFVALIGAIPVFLIEEGEGPSAEDDHSEEEDSDDSDDMEDSGLLSVNGVTVEEEAIVDDEDERDPNSPLLRRHQGYGTTRTS